MAFDNYTDIRTGADEVARLISNQRAILISHKAGISSVVTELTALSTQYGPIVDGVNAQVTGDPTNVGKLNLKADILQLLADFTALQTAAVALDALVNPPPP